MIILEKIKKRYDNFLLTINELKINSGEYFVIIGPSGSGKTTLLEIIAGFRKPDSGKVFLNETEITNLPIRKRNTVYCSGRYLFPKMNIYEHLKFADRERNFHKDEIIKIATNFGINDKLDKLPNQLSMGERQKVSLAMAFISQREVILLDEPLNSLDYISHEDMIENLQKMHTISNSTIIHITHNFKEASILGDKIAIMHNGKIIQIGAPKEIITNPKNTFVARFIGYKNILPKKMIFGKGENNILIHPNDIIIHKERKKREYIKAIINKIYPISLSQYEISFQIKHNKNLFTQLPYREISSLKEGDTVFLEIKKFYEIQL
jgi:molybdate transport system ATP-binding protein